MIPTPLPLEPLNRMTATEAVAQRLIGLINGGYVSPGDRLPPERELASRLGVGRTTVREALKLLQLSGLLEARRGDGTYLRRDYSSFVARQLEWPALLSAQDVEEIYEVREALEVKTAALAAARATAEEIERIAIYRRQRELDDGDVDGITDMDLSFHEAIAAASHNALLARLMLAQQNLLRQYIRLSNERTNDQRTTYQEHEAVYVAIAARDPQAAARAMTNHLTMSRSWILSQASTTRGTNDSSSTSDGAVDCS